MPLHFNYLTITSHQFLNVIQQFQYVIHHIYSNNLLMPFYIHILPLNKIHLIHKINLMSQGINLHIHSFFLYYSLSYIEISLSISLLTPLNQILYMSNLMPSVIMLYPPNIMAPSYIMTLSLIPFYINSKIILLHLIILISLLSLILHYLYYNYLFHIISRQLSRPSPRNPMPTYIYLFNNIFHLNLHPLILYTSYPFLIPYQMSS